MIREVASSLNNSEFQFIRQYVYEATGIVLSENKREMVHRRLMKCIRDSQTDSFTSYINILKSDDVVEKTKFINAITTNLTSFFREKHHFDYIREYIPTLTRQVGNKRLRIWSAGCSTGEEPYSIAITLQQIMGSQLSTWDTRILATDLDTEVLDQAREGIYKKARVEDLPLKLKKKWFRSGSGSLKDHVKVDARLSEMIAFKQLNLLHNWPMQGPFDVIFCRNVMIYFDKPTQHDLIDRFYHLLKPEGVLIIGHSENLGRHANLFDTLGHTIFKKTNTGTTISQEEYKEPLHV